MTPPQQQPTVAFFEHAFGEWRTEFREILESHKRDIQARLEKLEMSMDKKSDKEHVTLMFQGLHEDLRRHAQDIDHIQRALTTKMNTESLWKLVGIVLTVATAFGGFIGFLVTLLMRPGG